MLNVVARSGCAETSPQNGRFACGSHSSSGPLTHIKSDLVQPAYAGCEYGRKRLFGVPVINWGLACWSWLADIWVLRLLCSSPSNMATLGQPEKDEPPVRPPSNDSHARNIKSEDTKSSKEAQGGGLSSYRVRHPSSHLNCHDSYVWFI